MDFSSDDEEALGMKTDPPEFYDAKADEKDEKWVQKLRHGRRSDAMLSCPACLCTVCMDCQQHDSDERQFRAMFVINCRVDTSKEVHPKAQSYGKRQRKGGSERNSEPSDFAAADFDRFHPVLCATCGQEMGVWGIADKVYRFWHVVPSTG